MEKDASPVVSLARGRRSLAVLGVAALCAIGAGALVWRTNAVEAGPVDGFHRLEFSQSYDMVVEDARNMCGPNATLPEGKMNVTVFEYTGKTPAGVFLVAQTRHDFCGLGGCPTRFFRINDRGVRGLLAQTDMRRVLSPREAAAASLTPIERDFALRPFRVSADGLKLADQDDIFDSATGEIGRAHV